MRRAHKRQWAHKGREAVSAMDIDGQKPYKRRPTEKRRGKNGAAQKLWREIRIA